MNKFLNWLCFWKKTPEQTMEAPEVVELPLREPQMRVIIERHPSPEFTTYHFDRQLCTTGHTFNFAYEDDAVRPYSLARELPVDPFALGIAEQIYAIPGIVRDRLEGEGVSISTHKIRVHKGRAFGDHQVEDAVLTAVAESFGLTIEDLDVRVESERHRQERRWSVDDGRLTNGFL